MAFHEIIVGGAGAQATMLARIITDDVKRTPVRGISNLFQIGVVTRGRGSIVNNEYTLFPKDGSKVEVKLPKIAKSFNEFQKYCVERLKTSMTASCLVI